MNGIKPETEKLMAAAAALRAAGIAWSVVGQRLQRNERTCRRWVEEHPDVWRRHLLQAERQLARECRAEARSTLRHLLRAGEEKSKLGAAQQLLKKPSRRNTPPSNGQPDDGELAAYIAMVRETSDEELQQQIAQILATEDAGAGAATAPSAETAG
jgi:hypothetical protein